MKTGQKLNSKFQIEKFMRSEQNVSFVKKASPGMVFQHDRTIFIASYQTKEIRCDEQLYNFKRLKSFILTNNDGIEIKENYSIASPERAFLDLLYLNKEYHFDNFAPLDWDKVYALLPLYGGNSRMKKNLKKYYQDYQKQQ